MTEEEVRELKSALVDLQRAFHELKVAHSELQEMVKQKEQRIEELESQLLKEKLRNLDLEKRLAKDSHNSSKPPSSDGYKRKPKAQRRPGRAPRSLAGSGSLPRPGPDALSNPLPPL